MDEQTLAKIEAMTAQIAADTAAIIESQKIIVANWAAVASELKGNRA